MTGSWHQLLLCIVARTATTMSYWLIRPSVIPLAELYKGLVDQSINQALSLPDIWPNLHRILGLYFSTISCIQRYIHHGLYLGLNIAMIQINDNENMCDRT